MNEHNDKSNIGYVYNLAVDMGAGRGLTLSGNFDKGASKEVMNAEIDKLMDVVKRQKARADIPAVESEIRITEAQLNAQRNDLVDLKKKYEGAKVPTQAENGMVSTKHQIDRLELNLSEQNRVLENLKKEAE